LFGDLNFISRMRCVIAFIGVLFHPCVAFRVESNSHHSLEADDTASLFSEDLVAALEEVEDGEVDETQQWCTAMSSRSTRSFRFELTYPNGDHVAMEFERHPRDPVIRLYRGRTWSVRLVRERDTYSGEMEESLEWTPVLRDNTTATEVDMIEDLSEPVEIDVRKDLAYIRRVPSEDEQQTGIRFGFMDGSPPLEFAGGLYYPENAMKRNLVRAFQQRQRQHEREVRAAQEGATSTEAPTEVDTLNRHAGSRRGDLNAGGAQSALDTTTGIVTQIYESGKFSAISAFAFSFLPIVGSNPFVLGLAWTATVAGLQTGVLWGAAFIVPSSIVSAIHSWRHERRELSMTASEKLFDKMSCHRMIGVCQGGEIIGQDSILAFARRPDGDILIPFTGDVDPNTQAPLDDIVTWGTHLNNTAASECPEEAARTRWFSR